ncbi:hypothetical protein WT15_03305 [Burkholderia stagnalis]|nr:hypothetical protein WS59_06860 [Burkholderia stagnalis]KVN69127.1 hypothetical protein WT15_03305 [Burkholderia stagnalis]KWK45527.1 hypothetical protein WT80_20870 [Burkholderia stagnalis]KWK65533.1 hypothetical protein WT81_32530 [Burkholderia stagnalis]KWO39481.1 hypothetical protein WT95_05015 [Burkholderia stagnalis]
MSMTDADDLFRIPIVAGMPPSLLVPRSRIEQCDKDDDACNQRGDCVRKYPLIAEQHSMHDAPQCPQRNEYAQCREYDPELLAYHDRLLKKGHRRLASQMRAVGTAASSDSGEMITFRSTARLICINGRLVGAAGIRTLGIRGRPKLSSMFD